MRVIYISVAINCSEIQVLRNSPPLNLTFLKIKAIERHLNDYILLQVDSSNYVNDMIKKFATTTEEIRRILRLVANFTGTGENNVGGGELYIREGALSLPSDLHHLNIFCSPGSRRQNALFH